MALTNASQLMEPDLLDSEIEVLNRPCLRSMKLSTIVVVVFNIITHVSLFHILPSLSEDDSFIVTSNRRQMDRKISMMPKKMITLSKLSTI